MRTIWKYNVFANQNSPQKHRIPQGAQFLSVQPDPGNMASSHVVAVYFEVNPDAPTVEADFYIIGTGHPRPKGLFLGSVVSRPFAWHIYARMNQ